MPDLIFEDWGLIDYQSALDRQLEWVDKVSRDENHPGFLVFCTHPPVVTTGRQTKPEDIFSWKGPVIEISRGGRATYHGPSQLVVYPIINLKNPRRGRGPQEIRGYLRTLEDGIVEVIKHYGINAVGKTAQKLVGAEAETDETGVWIGKQKIASLGIAVKKWVCFHGAAVNLSYDPEAFQGLNPCGFTSATMTSLEQQLNAPIDRAEFAVRLKDTLLKTL